MRSGNRRTASQVAEHKREKPMMHLTKRKSCKNPDGTFKTFDQMMRAQMTVAQYGKFLAETQKGGANAQA
jgi:hypothetical protein